MTRSGSEEKSKSFRVWANHNTTPTSRKGILDSVNRSQTTELDDNAHNLSIHAQVLFKAEDKTEAIAVQKGSIERAKKEKYTEKDLAVLTGLLKEMSK